MVEGAPLLREYALIAHRGFESLPLRHLLAVGKRKRPPVGDPKAARPLLRTHLEFFPSLKSHIFAAFSAKVFCRSSISSSVHSS